MPLIRHGLATCLASCAVLFGGDTEARISPSTSVRTAPVPTACGILVDERQDVSQHGIPDIHEVASELLRRKPRVRDRAAVYWP